MKTLITIAVVLSVLYPARAQQPNTEQLNKEQALNYFAQATINWEKSSTAGMHAEMVMLKKSVENGKTVVSYRIKVTGAPPLKKYKLVAWPITFASPVDVMDGLMIDASGRVGCPPHSKDSCSRNFDGMEIPIKYEPSKGEIYRNALVSSDTKSRVFFSVVPEPITGRDGACSLDVVQVQPSFELVLIHARGFQPSEAVMFHTRSYEEVHEVQPIADAQGQFWVPLTPYVEGKTSGTTDITTKGSKCSPSISFKWGAAQ